MLEWLWIETFLENHNRKPQSFYEKRLNREMQEQEAIEKLKDLDISASQALSQRSAGESPNPEEELLRRQQEFIDQQKARVAASGNKTFDASAAGLDWLKQFVESERGNGDKFGSLSDSDSDISVEPQSRSRYEQEYKALSVLGRGGGGEVIKVCDPQVLVVHVCHFIARTLSLRCGIVWISIFMRSK